MTHFLPVSEPQNTNKNTKTKEKKIKNFPKEGNFLRFVSKSERTSAGTETEGKNATPCARILLFFFHFFFFFWWQNLATLGTGQGGRLLSAADSGKQDPAAA